MWKKKNVWWEWLARRTFKYDTGDDTGYSEINAVLDNGDLRVTVRPNCTDDIFNDLLNIYLGITKAVCEMVGMTPKNYVRAVYSILRDEEEYATLFTYDNGESVFAVSSGGCAHKKVGGKWYPLYREKPPEKEKEKEKVRKEEPPKVYMDRQSKKYRVSKVDPKDSKNAQNDDIFGMYSKFHGSSFWYFDKDFGTYESAADAQAELDAYALEQGWEVCRG